MQAVWKSATSVLCPFLILFCPFPIILKGREELPIPQPQNSHGGATQLCEHGHAPWLPFS